MTDEARYRAAEARLWASLHVQPSERRIRLSRNEVMVRVVEIGEGPAILFIHGANTSGASWASLASRLDGFRRIILDRPGTGLSEPLHRPLDVDRLPAFGETLAVDVLDALEIESAHLIATSFGGYVALRSAAAHPDRFGRMVQFSWPAGAPIAHLPMFMRLPTLPGLGRLVAALPANERTVRMTFRQVGHAEALADGRITPEDLETYLALLRDTDTMRHELALGRAFVSPWHGLDRIVLDDAVLASVRTPTWFVWGERDPFGGPETARDLVARMPDAGYEVVPGAGHAPWLDALQHSASVTGDFLRG